MIKIFNTTEVSQETFINELRNVLTHLVPYVSVHSGVLGKDTIMVLVSFDKKEDWRHGYVENSNYFRMSIESDGVMEEFVQSIYIGGESSIKNRLGFKFRKSTCKSREVVINKLVDFINKINSVLS